MSQYATQEQADAAFKAATSVGTDFHLERLRRARFKGDPEHNDYCAPVDPRDITDAKPLTKSQQELVDQVFGVAFRTIPRE